MRLLMRRFGHSIRNALSKLRSVVIGVEYTRRMTVYFACIAAMTAFIAVCVVSIVWEQYFNLYTRDNIQSLANATAQQISRSYDNSHSFSASTLATADNAARLYAGMGVMVTDAQGTVVYNSADHDRHHSTLARVVPARVNGATSPIYSNGKIVGTVRLWIEGSDTLLRNADKEFRSQSYGAMMCSTLIALVLASLLGYLFARNLMRPIKRMRETAMQLKEGNLSARTGLKGRDEVSLLGRTFDDMASAIERDRTMERRLTTDVAHELRTPLMAIQSTVEAMIDKVFPADEQHLVTVNTEVQRLGRLVDSLLKLSRLENRSVPFKEDRLNLAQLIDGIISTHESYVHDAGLRLHYHAQHDVYVRGDGDMLRQATANLISNAVRYTPAGSVTVQIGASATEAYIAVRDTGVGLSPEEAKMVFERFWRADEHRSRASGGLGIGLSVVREIIERHHGRIQVEGEKGKGACFTIFLPRCS